MPTVKQPSSIRRVIKEGNEHYKEHQGGTIVSALLVFGGWVVAWTGLEVPAWVGIIGVIAIGVVVAVVSASLSSNKKLMEYDELRRPKISTSCGHGYRGPNVLMDSLRIIVQSESDAPIKNCQARLISVKRGGVTCFDENYALLTFSPAESPDTHAKTIPPRQKEKVDVVYVHKAPRVTAGTITGGWNFTPSVDEVFSGIGDYFLTVVISGDDIPPETVHLKFAWTGNWKTATLEKL